MILRILILAFTTTFMAFTVSAAAQNPYAPAVTVNGSIITNYEIQQRILMMQALGSSGDLEKQSIDQLIDDRLRVEAAKSLGLVATDEEIQNGMDEFAARANLTGDQLIQYLAQRGIARETFRDFVNAGLIWRSVIQTRFASKGNVSDAEVDATLSLSAAGDSESILISELVMPVQERGDVATMELANRLSKSIKSEAAFASAARKYSRASTAGRGGRLDWLPVASLPPAVAGQVMALEPGEVTAPIAMGGAIGLFQFRGIRTDNQSAEQVVSATYVQMRLPAKAGGTIESQRKFAIKIRDRVDTCFDLTTISKEYGEDLSTEHSLPISDIPTGVALELAELDPGETGTLVSGPNRIQIVMLCSRATELTEGARDTIREALFSRRMNSFGSGYLQELKGDAAISYK